MHLQNPVYSNLKLKVKFWLLGHKRDVRAWFSVFNTYESETQGEIMIPSTKSKHIRIWNSMWNCDFITWKLNYWPLSLNYVFCLNLKINVKFWLLVHKCNVRACLNVQASSSLVSALLFHEASRSCVYEIQAYLNLKLNVKLGFVLLIRIIDSYHETMCYVWIWN